MRGLKDSAAVGIVGKDHRHSVPRALVTLLIHGFWRWRALNIGAGEHEACAAWILLKYAVAMAVGLRPGYRL